MTVERTVPFFLLKGKGGDGLLYCYVVVVVFLLLGNKLRDMGMGIYI